jgi:hypothetical protein
LGNATQTLGKDNPNVGQEQPKRWAKGTQTSGKITPIGVDQPQRLGRTTPTLGNNSHRHGLSLKRVILTHFRQNRANLPLLRAKTAQNWVILPKRRAKLPKLGKRCIYPEARFITTLTVYTAHFMPVAVKK